MNNHHMKHFRARLALLALLGGLGLSGQVQAEEPIVLVATSRNVPLAQLTARQVADLFLGQSLGELKLRPIDSSDETLRERFYQRVAGLSANRARAVWARLVFATRQTPPLEMSPEEAAQQLLTTGDAITYLYRDRLPKGTKVLLVLP